MPSTGSVLGNKPVYVFVLLVMFDVSWPLNSKVFPTILFTKTACPSPLSTARFCTIPDALVTVISVSTYLLIFSYIKC